LSDKEELNKINVKPSDSSEDIDACKKSIDKLDMQVNIADENGLFKEQKNAEALETILSSLKKAREKLQGSPPELPSSYYELSVARSGYYKAVQNAPWLWRFSKLYAANVLAYLLLFLASIFLFYYFRADILLAETLNIDSDAINATAWGTIGGILRGISRLWYRVNRREFRDVWKGYFISSPFLGGLFGSIVYLLILAGIIIASSSSQQVEGVLNPFVIMPFCAYAGYNWEWAVNQFSRVGGDRGSETKQ
jgi:hypothetical protein